MNISRTEAVDVLTTVGKERVLSDASNQCNTAAFVAVSPNRLIGPCTSATDTPQ